MLRMGQMPVVSWKKSPVEVREEKMASGTITPE
jgi:hypothetical protein